MNATTLFRFVQLRDTQFLDAPTPKPDQKADDDGRDERVERSAGSMPIEVGSDEVQRFYTSVEDEVRQKPILAEAENVLREAQRDRSVMADYVGVVEHIRANPSVSFDDLVDAFGLDVGDRRAATRHRNIMAQLPKRMAAADILGDRAEQLRLFADAGRGALALTAAITGAPKITRRWPRPIDIASAPVFMDSEGTRRFDAPETSTAVISQIVSSATMAATSSRNDFQVKGQPHSISIGDLYVVEEIETDYVMGDIAHVENVLKSERREREFTISKMEEVETLSESEQTQRQENERVTNQNQSFQSAISSTLKKSSALGIMAGVEGGFGPVKFAAGVTSTSTNSKTSAKGSASSFAKSVMDRSVEEVTSRVLERRRQLTRTEITDRSANGFDNRQGPNHVVGIYRFLDKMVTSQTRNYGARMMLEFVIPEPAAVMVKLSETEAAHSGGAKKPQPPFIEQPADIDEDTYREMAARYGVDNVTPPPPEVLRINKSFNTEPSDKSDFAPPGLEEPDLDKQNPNFGYATGRLQFNDLPEGYYAFKAQASLANVEKTFVIANEGKPHEHYATRIELAMGHTGGALGTVRDATSATGFRINNVIIMDLGLSGLAVEGPVELSYSSSSAYGMGVSVDLFLRRSQRAYDEWQMEVWSQIRATYDAKLEAWEAEQTIQSVTGRSFGNNPRLNRVAERRELKTGALSILLNHDFGGLSAIQRGRAGLPVINYEKAERQGRAITFFEEIFDWENLSFQLYDYAWAGRGRWDDLAARTSSDPEHQDFLRAGAAKVTIPVQLGAEIAVLHMLAKGEIWGQWPSEAVQEAFPDLLKRLEQAGLSPEKNVDPDEDAQVIATETTRVPTNLVILQDGPSPNATGWVGPIELPPPDPAEG